MKTLQQILTENPDWNREGSVWVEGRLHTPTVCEYCEQTVEVIFQTSHQLRSGAFEVLECGCDQCPEDYNPSDDWTPVDPSATVVWHSVMENSPSKGR